MAQLESGARENSFILIGISREAKAKNFRVKSHSNAAARKGMARKAAKEIATRYSRRGERELQLRLRGGHSALRTRGDGFHVGHLGRNLSAVDLLGEAKLLEDPDAVPIDIRLVPFQAVASGSRMGVMIIVPALAEGEESDKEIVGGMIAGGEAARTPDVRGGIDEPGGVEAENGAEKDAPEEKRPSANRQKDEAEDNHGNIVVLGDPDVETIFGEIGDVTSERGGVVMHGFADEDPAHVRPPFAVERGMRIAFLVGELMMNAVRGDPEDRAAFQSESGADREHIFEPFGSLIAAMSEQAVITDADTETAGDPEKENREEQGLPGEKENGSQGAEMKKDHERGCGPIDASFLRVLFFKRLEARDDGAGEVPGRRWGMVSAMRRNWMRRRQRFLVASERSSPGGIGRSGSVVFGWIHVGDNSPSPRLHEKRGRKTFHLAQFAQNCISGETTQNLEPRAVASHNGRSSLHSPDPIPLCHRARWNARKF
jgi:hypothetical protein